MKSLLTLSLLLLTAVGYGQDSVALKILSKPVTIKDTTYYHVRIDWMGGKEKVIVACCCKDKTIRRKGEYVLVAKKDLEFKQ